MMKRAGWYLHPIIVFVFSSVALVISLFLYIYWYVGVSEGLQSVVRRYQLDAGQFFEARTWVVILVLSILVAVILAGILVIFIYHMKTLQLYHLQNSFINNFTHELKTPVTSLKLYLETFLRHALPREEQERYIGYMLQDTERLSCNINSILNLTRIESKRYEKEFVPVDLVEALRGFVAANRHAFPGCDISVESRPGLPVIQPVIPPLLDILLMNILTNAVKYNVSGSPRVEISVERQRRPLLVRFRDNGIGVAKNEQKKIFRKFYQGRHEHVPAGGSGIGLYLVQQIARLHGGRVTVSSEGENRGSVFTLSLP